ncbi:uncharacterized protein LOC122020982 isoform X1 [Zingiber officinale]|uniref:Uncharacterized protein n=1 Tax=Zingiber officinale TaxID=94328 RepID=A0A8J5EZG6_ZINOF|nr:uncharacterized protein LOC122020982 isoform X1 [Zingiber officinale]KAG6478053.1 hypothetical protein ZIOFF_061485 [Zingiber officinale]
MGGAATLVGVKRVGDSMPREEWDDTMPLPGDIVQGVAPSCSAGDDQEQRLAAYSAARTRSELSNLLSLLSRRSSSVWVKVQRGGVTLELRTRVTSYRGSNLYRRYTVMAAGDDRHVAVLGDMTPQRCTELQGESLKPLKRSKLKRKFQKFHLCETEMSRSVVNMDGISSAFDRKKNICYDWKKKKAIYLPDRNATLVSSILFKPFPTDRCVDAVTRRAMAWFSAAVSSGAPLVFVNVQTELFWSTSTVRSRHNQQASKSSLLPVKQLLAVRLWFLPGTHEIPVLVSPEEGETRFGLDIKRTEEGFIYISSVSRGSAADRAGLLSLCDEASKSRNLLVISRLEGRGIIPAEASPEGLIRCCDQAGIKAALATAIRELEEVRLHVMAWPNHRPCSANCKMDAGHGLLLPPAVTSSPQNLHAKA